MFADCRHRIHSMTPIHQNLYQSEGLAQIDVGAYLQHLARTLFRAYAINPEHVQLSVCVDNVRLTLDTAVPCALIRNELLSNCLKHAFPHEQAGHIWVTFCREPDGTLRLCVRDDGVGFPEGTDFQTTNSFGLQLVRLLARQLRATVAQERHPGTSVTLTFVEPA